MTWALRLASVVAVLALVAAACGGDNASAPSTSAVPVPTTTLTPTTTAAPVATTLTSEEPIEEEPEESALSEEDLEVAAAFVSAFNTGDSEILLQLFDPSATVNTLLSPESNVDRYGLEIGFQRALNASWEIHECELEYGAISCDVETLRDDLNYIQGPLPAKIRLIVKEGAITSFSAVENRQTIATAMSAFRDWVSDHHPESLQPMFSFLPDRPTPQVTDESVALWVELIPEYLESKSG